MNSNWFQSVTPESVGLPSEAILNWIEMLEKEKIGIDSFIMMRHHSILAEGYWAPFSQGDPHRLFSAGKAIMSTAILFAIDEGLLHLDDVVSELLRDSLPDGYSDKYDRMTLYHLLTMNTGHTKDTFSALLSEGGDREKTFLSIPPEKEPGSHFLYNNGVPDILGIILYKYTGQRVFEYLEPRLFHPLGMDGMFVERYRHLDELPTMSASTRSLMKLAVFYADHGCWNGRQLISRELADMAGSYLTPSLQDPEPALVAYDTKFGYGFQIWRNSVGGFRIDGGRGQFGIVIPEMDFVMAINATEQDQGILPITVWEHITNRMYAHSLPENPEAYQRLLGKLRCLTWAEKGTNEPEKALFKKSVLSTPRFGTSFISLQLKDEEILLKTDVTGEEPISLGKLNAGTWQPVRLPLIPEDRTYYGSAVKHGATTGGNPDEAFACVLCRTPEQVEIHLRSKGYMGGKIYRISKNMLTFMPYDDYARQNRSDTVKHPNLDRCACPGVIEIPLI